MTLVKHDQILSLFILRMVKKRDGKKNDGEMDQVLL